MLDGYKMERLGVFFPFLGVNLSSPKVELQRELDRLDSVDTQCHITPHVRGYMKPLSSLSTASSNPENINKKEQNMI